MKVEDGELLEDADEAGKDMKKDSTREGISGTGTADQSNGKSSISDRSGWSQRDGKQRTSKMVNSSVYALLMNFGSRISI